MRDLDIRDATRELNILRALDRYRAPFTVIGRYRLVDDGDRPEATVMLRAGEHQMHEADVGVGPVDALGKVLKKSLGRLFPELKRVKLLDFASAVIQGTTGTSATVAVTIVFTDGKTVWRVSSSSDNINLASFNALLDGYEFAILERGQAPFKDNKVAREPGVKSEDGEKSAKTAGARASAAPRKR